MARNRSIEVLNGRARLAPPTTGYPRWRVYWLDPVTLKWRNAVGGHSQDEAEARAAALLGDFVPGRARTQDEVPSLREVFESWVDDNRHRWSSRTVDSYTYLANRFLKQFGEHKVSSVSPTQLRQVNVSDLSRGQQEKVRTLVRGTFTHAKEWIRSPVESYAQGIRISGSRASARNQRVQRGDIPTLSYIASVIVTAHHTSQLGPLDHRDTTLDPVTGIKEAPSRTAYFAPGLGMTRPDEHHFIMGLPPEQVTAMRRGMPKHYTNKEQRARDETEELASRFRQAALITALGAGGGLRIGEILALRVRHFLSPQQATAHFFTGAGFDLPLPDRVGEVLRYRGRVRVEEQASQASKGKVWVTLPKGGRPRAVNLPAFLPHWSWSGQTGTSVRAGIAQHMERFADPSVSLWDATPDEAQDLWREGFTPLGWMLWERFNELWQQVPENSPSGAINDFMDMLLFPTRNRARAGGRVHHEDNWPHSVRIVEGQGTYQVQTNYAGRMSNPLYDYVSGIYQSWPQHRTNSGTRRGWTHHGLRHFAVSSRIAAGIPLTDIAEEMGHKDAGFTLSRYGHVIGHERTPQGFEY